jgi:hypothetical protein
MYYQMHYNSLYDKATFVCDKSDQFSRLILGKLVEMMICYFPGHLLRLVAFQFETD